MKELRYTLIGEGIAEDKFIPAYLEKTGSQKTIRTIRSKLRIPESTRPSSSKVLAKLAQSCQLSLIQQQEPLFIAGVDLDEADHANEKHHTRIKELEGKLGFLFQNHSNKIILFVPIQCIDHWLCYQHYKVSGTKKPAANSLESISGDEIKKRLYGKGFNRVTIERMIAKILEQCDFDELAKQSRSFKHFHERVTKFMTEFA